MFANFYLDKLWKSAEDFEPVIECSFYQVLSKVMQELCKPYSSYFFLSVLTFTRQECMTFSPFKALSRRATQ